MAIRQAVVALMLFGCGGAEVVPPDAGVDAAEEAAPQALTCVIGTEATVCSKQAPWVCVGDSGGPIECQSQSGAMCHPGDTCRWGGDAGIVQ